MILSNLAKNKKDAINVSPLLVSAVTDSLALLVPRLWPSSMLLACLIAIPLDGAKDYLIFAIISRGVNQFLE